MLTAEQMARYEAILATAPQAGLSGDGEGELDAPAPPALTRRAVADSGVRVWGAGGDAAIASQRHLFEYRRRDRPQPGPHYGSAATAHPLDVRWPAAEVIDLESPPPAAAPFEAGAPHGAAPPLREPAGARAALQSRAVNTHAATAAPLRDVFVKPPARPSVASAASASTQPGPARAASDASLYGLEPPRGTGSEAALAVRLGAASDASPMRTHGMDASLYTYGFEEPPRGRAAQLPQAPQKPDQLPSPEALPAACDAARGERGGGRDAQQLEAVLHDIERLGEELFAPLPNVAGAGDAVVAAVNAYRASKRPGAEPHAPPAASPPAAWRALLPLKTRSPTPPGSPASLKRHAYSVSPSPYVPARPRGGTPPPRSMQEVLDGMQVLSPIAPRGCEAGGSAAASSARAPSLASPAAEPAANLEVVGPLITCPHCAHQWRHSGLRYNVPSYVGPQSPLASTGGSPAQALCARGGASPVAVITERPTGGFDIIPLYERSAASFGLSLNSPASFAAGRHSRSPAPPPVPATPLPSHAARKPQTQQPLLSPPPEVPSHRSMASLRDTGEEAYPIEPLPPTHYDERNDSALSCGGAADPAARERLEGMFLPGAWGGGGARGVSPPPPPEGGAVFLSPVGDAGARGVEGRLGVEEMVAVCSPEKPAPMTRSAVDELIARYEAAATGGEDAAECDDPRACPDGTGGCGDGAEAAARSRSPSQYGDRLAVPQSVDAARLPPAPEEDGAGATAVLSFLHRAAVVSREPSEATDASREERQPCPPRQSDTCDRGPRGAASPRDASPDTVGEETAGVSPDGRPPAASSRQVAL